MFKKTRKILNSKSSPFRIKRNVFSLFKDNYGHVKSGIYDEVDLIRENRKEIKKYKKLWILYAIFFATYLIIIILIFSGKIEKFSHIRTTFLSFTVVLILSSVLIIKNRVK